MFEEYAPNDAAKTLLIIQMYECQFCHDKFTLKPQEIPLCYPTDFTENKHSLHTRWVVDGCLCSFMCMRNYINKKLLKQDPNANCHCFLPRYMLKSWLRAIYGCTIANIIWKRERDLKIKRGIPLNTFVSVKGCELTLQTSHLAFTSHLVKHTITNLNLVDGNTNRQTKTMVYEKTIEAQRAEIYVEKTKMEITKHRHPWQSKFHTY